MFDFFTADANLPFSIAVLLLLLLAAVEMAGLLLGGGLLSLLDDWLPSLDLDGPPQAPQWGALSAVLGWLYLGRLPLLVWLPLTLVGFGLGGWLLQAGALALTGQWLPTGLAVILATILVLLLLSLGGRALIRLLPQQESYAVSTDSFIGRPAVISYGVARADLPAQAAVTDPFGHKHYVAVVPQDGCPIDAGTQVVLLERDGQGRFIVLPLDV